MQQIGLVAIGRNEGERLRQCLLSVAGQVDIAVYVDSGSTDGSLELARSLGVEVIELNLSTPFTAARARNAGFAHLLQIAPELKYVQFVDGDCEVVPTWIAQAHQTLEANPEWAVVCGRRRERFPDATIYNKFCDLEWSTQTGEVKACGGDAMFRVPAFQQVGGFNPALIAGEEPELCLRLRQNGWKIWRLDAEMTLHDAQMTRFSQWWKRTQRAGHAYAEGAWLHGRTPERHWVKESVRIWVWAFGVPAFALAGAGLTHGWSLLLFCLYLLLAYRATQWGRQRGFEAGDARQYGFFCVLGKFAELQGQIQFFVNKLLRQRSSLIEYKQTPLKSSS